MSGPRMTRVFVEYNGTNITGEISEYMEQFTYTDIASGESDRIAMKLADTEQKWMSYWMPENGDRIGAEIIFHNWFMDGALDKLYCGEFQIDDLSFSGRPFTCMIGAVSIPQDKAFHNQNRTKTWENTTVQQIGEEIAQRAGITLYYEADTIEVANIEQDEQTDSDFYYAICQSYGLAVKVFANKIVVFDEEVYEKRQSMAKLYEKDVISWSYNTTTKGTYTGAVFSFLDPDNEEEYMVKIGGGNRILELNVTADNIKDAERKGIALLNNENKKATTMSLKMKSNPGFIAGKCLDMEGFGKLGGKYYIEEIKTAVNGKGATQMSLSLRRVVERIKTISSNATEEAQEENAETGIKYTIKQGDSLWMIAKKYLKNGKRYGEIYELNKETIEEAAKNHGRSDSNAGNWIWAGTVITIPADRSIN